jgi:hypothetical protein
MSRQSMIAPLGPRIEPPANLGWHWIRRLSALFSKKVLGRVAAKCMMCATPTAWLQSVQTQKNIMNNNNNATAVTEEEINSLLREATDAEQQAHSARVWASPEYVSSAQAAASAAWTAYRAASASAAATTTASSASSASATLATKFHRDNSVTLWNVYSQTWQRVRASRVSDEILSSLSAGERARIARMAARC